MDLQERVALLVEGYQWDSGECEAEARLIAKSILAIPEIRDALARPKLHEGILMVLGGERDHMPSQDVAAVQRFASKIALQQYPTT